MKTLAQLVGIGVLSALPVFSPAQEYRPSLTMEQKSFPEQYVKDTVRTTTPCRDRPTPYDLAWSQRRLTENLERNAEQFNIRKDDVWYLYGEPHVKGAYRPSVVREEPHGFGIRILF